MYTERNLKAGNDIFDICLKLENNEMEDHIRNMVKQFKDTYIDMDKMNDRGELYTLLEHTSTLFLNLSLNYNQYFYGKKEEEKGFKGREIINKIRKEIRENTL